MYCSTFAQTLKPVRFMSLRRGLATGFALYKWLLAPCPQEICVLHRLHPSPESQTIILASISSLLLSLHLLDGLAG